MAKEQDVLRLPFRITEFNEDMLVALDRNFKEIEDRLSTLQLLMKSISGGSVNDIVDTVLLIKNNALAALANAAAAQETADGQIQGFFQNEAPAEGMGFGDIWIDIDGHIPPTVNDIYRYEDVDHGSGGDYDWRAAPTNAIGKIYLNAYLAQTTANSKIKTYYQETAPSGDLTEGDYWIDTSDHNKPYRWNGTEWQDARDTASSAVGMAAGLTCTGLWHFDGTLNNQKGVAAVTDGGFLTGKWGQGLEVASGETLKIPTASVLDKNNTSVNFQIYNLALSPNGSVIFDLGDSDGNQAVKVGISAVVGHEGELFVEDEAVQYAVAETSEDDFNEGTLTDVQSNATGDLTLAVTGTNFAVTEDTQAEFESGVLSNTEYNSGLKLKYTPGSLVYGADFTGGKTYSASSYYSETYAPSKAFDNNESTYWWSTHTPSVQWLKVDLGAGVTKVAKKLTIKCDAKSIYLQGSNNNSSWTDICLIENPDNNSVYEYTFNNTVGYRYYRFYTDTNDYLGTRIYEVELMEATQTPGTYALTGTWVKDYNLAAVGVARGSAITWAATTPADTSVVVQAAIATDGINYGSYADCTSGSAIPGITAGMDLSSARVKFKVTLATTDNTITPSLDSLTLNVYSAYKTSGNRVHVYDISGVGIAELSEITWNATLPTGTSIAVKAAISTDGGSSYGAFQTCTSGQAIPVLTEDMDISNARLKIQEDLTTSDYSATPKLNSLNFSVSKAANIAYGTNKSELIGWDNIAIQWKTERLSLIINGAESAYIENPGQVTTLATYAFIGSDKAGANQIGTIIDELRIDNAYIDIENVNKWNLMDSPFYTSEEMKQWPGYVKIETEGLKVYDSEGNLRLLVGSWLKGLIRKYGIKVIDGEIYSSIIRSGAEDATAYIQFAPPNRLEVFGNSSAGTHLKMLEIGAPDDISEGKGGQMDFYLNGNFMGVVAQQADAFWILNAADIKMSNLNVVGSKNCIEDTPYGQLAISARESPEVRYIDEGMGILINGECRIDIDPIFMECIEPHTEHSKWYIDLTPYGKAILYVDEIGDNYFIVRDYNDNANGVEFKWSLSATRKNYAHIRFREVV
jgi:hypothetical protein